MRRLQREGRVRKVFCIGLGKTGTTTFGSFMEDLGYKHHPTICAYGLACYRSGNFDRLFDIADNYDSFDDFPWPLLYKELADQYPDAKFVLTTREDADVWYKSLCKHYDRTGPTLAKRLSYGVYSPHEDPDYHKDFYLSHNRNVEQFFNGTGRLIQICWEKEGEAERLLEFLEEKPSATVRVSHLKNLNGWTPKQEIAYLMKVGQVDHAEKRAAFHSEADEEIYQWFLDCLYKKTVIPGRIRSTVVKYVPRRFRS
jgi:hypothetical protein